MHELLTPDDSSRAQAIERCERYLAGSKRNWPLVRVFLRGASAEGIIVWLVWNCLTREIAEAPADAARSRGLDELDCAVTAALDSRARSPLEKALSAWIPRHGVPGELLRRPLAEWRREEHLASFETGEALLAHARALAAPEGRSLLRVLGLETPRREALADSLAAALQLMAWAGNIGRDLERGRVRLPMDTLARFGVDLGAVLARREDDALARALAAHVGWVRSLYAKGWELCRELGPWRGRQLAFVLRWHAAELSALEARRFRISAQAPRAGWLRILACGLASGWSPEAPRFA